MILQHSTAHHVDAIVIGAGVLGLSVARTLAKTMKKEVLILERSDAFGSGTSSRNSEVIHAGLYYPSNSMKAKMCVRGRELLYEYCQERGVEYKKIGKLIVASSREQYDSKLMEIKYRGEMNGVPNLKLLSQNEVQMMEPEVNCFGALYSPETGVVDSHGLMLSLLGEAEDHGATLAYNANVDHIEYQNHNGNDHRGPFLVRSQNMDLTCDILINCAGLFAGHISKTLFGNNNQMNASPSPALEEKSSIDKSHSYEQSTRSFIPTRQYYAKGNYYRLQNQKNPFHHLIYPVPEPGGLGVHGTIDLGGNCRFGPDVEWISHKIKNPDNIDLDVNSQQITKFYDEIRKYWPNLQDGNLAPDYAGIRPKLDHPFILQEELKNNNLSSATPVVAGNGDFVIQGEKVHGMTGYIHMMGIESPGLTSSLAIAEKIANILTNSR